MHDHVGELRRGGLVAGRTHGISKMLTTGDRFPEYFGVPETEPERIRTCLAEKLGLKVGPKKVVAAEEAPAEVPEGPPAEEPAVEPAAAPPA